MAADYDENDPTRLTVHQIRRMIAANSYSMDHKFRNPQGLRDRFQKFFTNRCRKLLALNDAVFISAREPRDIDESDDIRAQVKTIIKKRTDDYMAYVYGADHDDEHLYTMDGHVPIVVLYLHEDRIHCFMIKIAIIQHESEFIYETFYGDLSTEDMSLRAVICGEPTILQILIDKYGHDVVIRSIE